MKSRADIPNEVGFQLIVVLTNGEKKKTKVILDTFGLHTLEGVKITDVQGWIDCSQIDITFCPPSFHDTEVKLRGNTQKGKEFIHSVFKVGTEINWLSIKKSAALDFEDFASRKGLTVETENFS